MRLVPILIVISLLITVPFLSDDSDGDFSVPRITAVYPTESFEGFAITNYGYSMDLKGYSVTDGEGTVSFTSSLILSSHETVYFCKSETPSWFGFDRVVHYGQNGVTMKGFALADTGDDLYLMKDDQIIDSVVYGNAKAVKGGWEGGPLEKITKKHIALRTSLIDTNSSRDWTITTPGRTSFDNDTVFDAQVAPISFPDDHQPLFSALQGAGRTIDISVYLISHPKIVSSLLHSMEKDVRVRILVEGSPAGGVTAAEIKALKTLESKGADVRVMGQNEGYRAYSYIHNKYAVIDSDTVIITSENWQESSFESNRGWGAVIISEGFASYMRKVFESDFYRTDDVFSFNKVFPTAEKSVYGRYQMADDEITFYDARVRPVISPDNSYRTMRSFILSAQERVYSEQLDVDYSWTEDDDTPIGWMRQVSVRTDCRLLVDVTFDDRNDSDFTDGYGVIDSLHNSSIWAKEPEFSGMSHNKGTIVDDMVWLGSINWTYNSFNDNREVAVIIDSPEVTDYFTGLFMRDWGEKEGIEEGSKYDANVSIQSKGDIFLLEVTNPVESDVYAWDLDGDGIFEIHGKKVIGQFPIGVNRVSLSIDDGDDIRIMEFELVSQQEQFQPDAVVPMKYYPIIAICVLILLFNIIRWKRCSDDTDKGIQGKRR